MVHSVRLALAPAFLRSARRSRWMPHGVLLPLSSWRRALHAALMAPGVGDALASLPGAGRDGKGHLMVPVPDKKLERLAELERTKPVAAVVEVVDIHKDLVAELVQVAEDTMLREEPAGDPPELSGKLMSALKAADAVVLAVPCADEGESGAGSPVDWLQAAEQALVLMDLQALETQVCKGGATGPDEPLDVAKLRKSLSASKDANIRRNADGLTNDLLAPGFSILRNHLRNGSPARVARPGLVPGTVESEWLSPQFEDLARGWLNALVTWKPLCILADVQPSSAGATSQGNSASRALSEHAKQRGLPCLTMSTSLEGEVAALRDEPDFLAEYLASFGLRGEEAAAKDSEDAEKTELWRTQSGVLAQHMPRLLNLLTFYTAGEKEARAWLCHRVGKDGLPRRFAVFGPEEADASRQASGSSGGGTGKGSSSKSKDAAELEDGVPAPFAARAIHTSFENRVKGLEMWRFEDLDALGAGDSGAKQRARAAGQVRKLPPQALVQEGDVVEFVLSS